jgi:hypothetical protein
VGGSVVVTLFAVPSGKRVTVSLTNVNTQGVNVGVAAGFLTGDLNASNTVTASDILIAKGRAESGTVDGTTYLADLDANGVIADPDITAVKAKSGTSLP